MERSYTTQEIQAMGLAPYAVYGGKVASFKLTAESKSILPIERLDEVRAASRDAISMAGFRV